MGTIVVAVMFVVLGGVSAWACRKVAALAGDRRDGRPVQGVAVLGRVLLAGGLALAGVTFVWSTFQVIPAGHVGIVTMFGRVQPLPLLEGLHLVNPLVDVTRLSVQVQKHEGKYAAASKDLQAVHVNMVLNYRLIPEQAPEVYQRIGKGYSTVITDPAAQEVLKANTALHNASEILFQRAKIKTDMQAGLTTCLAKYGIELREVSLANIEFDASYQRAIEAKGEGDAFRIKGEAEATYNAQVAASLTSVLIQQQYLSRWDGKLPVYMLA